MGDPLAEVAKTFGADGLGGRMLSSAGRSKLCVIGARKWMEM